MHQIDARCKIVLMVAYSIALFLVNGWPGLLALAVLFALAAASARLNLAHIAHQLIPIGFIMLVTLIANSFTVDVTAAQSASAGEALAGPLGGIPPIAILGSFGFWPAGFGRGCFFALRIALLVGASLVLTTTTTSTQTSHALESFLKPLQRIGLPVRDVATVASIALRFIPLTIDEFQRTRAAQTARGAQFDTGGLLRRLKSWQTVLVPWFVGLYRRADELACALDARCYGAAEATRLTPLVLDGRSMAVLAAGLAACAAIGAVL